LSSGPSFASYCAFVSAPEVLVPVLVVEVVVVVEVAADDVEVFDVDDFFDELPHPATAIASTAAATAEAEVNLLKEKSPLDSHRSMRSTQDDAC
jgi:hypothetical protein